MNNNLGRAKQMFSKKQNHVALVTSLVWLLSPCFAWFLFGSYQTAVQIPGEWAQFETQESQIIQALREFNLNNREYPERLASLAPEYLNTPIWQSEKWSFHYGRYEDGEYFLAADVPELWFGWPTRRVCRSQQENVTQCNFHFVCQYRQGVEVLTEPIDHEQSFRRVWEIQQTNPCTS